MIVDDGNPTDESLGATGIEVDPKFDEAEEVGNVSEVWEGAAFDADMVVVLFLGCMCCYEFDEFMIVRVPPSTT